MASLFVHRELRRRVVAPIRLRSQRIHLRDKLIEEEAHLIWLILNHVRSYWLYLHNLSLANMLHWNQLNGDPYVQYGLCSYRKNERATNR